MKKVLLLLAGIFSMLECLAQTATFEGERVSTLDGHWKDMGTLDTGGKPLILVFWNTDSRECLSQVQALIDTRDAALKPYGVKLVGIFVENGNRNRIKPMIMGRDWDMEAYVDVNGEFTRYMSVAVLPFTILYDSDKKMICSHVGFCSGTEDLLCKKVKECLAEVK